MYGSLAQPRTMVENTTPDECFLQKEERVFEGGRQGLEMKGWIRLAANKLVSPSLFPPPPSQSGSWTQTATPPLSKAVGNWVLHQKLLHFRLETLKNYMLLLYFNTEVQRCRSKRIGSNYNRSPLSVHCSSPGTTQKRIKPFPLVHRTHPPYLLSL